MVKNVIWWTYFCSSLLFVMSWEPSVDYCQILCFHYSKKGEHSACKCKERFDKKFSKLNISSSLNDLIDDNFQEFRQAVLDVHNELRNKLAGGSEKEKGYLPAANMMALSYDLETEYIARCWAGKMDEVRYDYCRNTADFKGQSDQNVAFLDDNGNYEALKNLSFIRDIVIDWYNDNDNVIGNKTAWVDKYDGRAFNHTTEKDFRRFLPMAWWSYSLIGCVRVHLKSSLSIYKNSLICNYGGARSEEDDQRVGRNVYQIGKPASNCPYGTKPSTKYENLCGEVEEIEETPPYR